MIPRYLFFAFEVSLLEGAVVGEWRHLGACIFLGGVFFLPF